MSTFVQSFDISTYACISHLIAVNFFSVQLCQISVILVIMDSVGNMYPIFFSVFFYLISLQIFVEVFFFPLCEKEEGNSQGLFQTWKKYRVVGFLD